MPCAGPGISALKGCLVDLKVSRDRIDLGYVLRADLATQKFIDIKAPKMEFNLPKQFEGRVIDRFEQKDKAYLRVMTPDKKMLCVPECPGMEQYMGKHINVERQEKGGAFVLTNHKTIENKYKCEIER
ncbi:MAG: hypothetical protein U1E78_12325 [Gammaproteobacteria bacterium]